MVVVMHHVKAAITARIAIIANLVIQRVIAVYTAKAVLLYDILMRRFLC